MNMSKLFTKGHKLNIIIALLCLAATLTFATMTAYAATSTQDGLTAAVTTDKTSYEAGETVTTTVSVTNGNDYAVNNVRMELTLPAGLTLKSGQTSIIVGTLEAGANQEYTLTALADKAEEPVVIPTVTPTIPQTGDNSHTGLYITLMLFSIAGLTAATLLRRKGRRTVKTLSVFLCFALVLSIVGPSIPVFAATENRTLTVTQPVTVDGESKNITLNVTYDYLLDAVNQTPLSITEGNLIKTYGDASFTLEATGGTTGNAVTWTSSDPAVASVVGTDDTHAAVSIHKAAAAPVTITAAMSGSLGNTGDTPDYLDTYAQITLTVNKKALTVTADDQSRDYGQENPAFTVQYDGFVNGEDETALATAPTASCGAGTNATAGTYAITVSGGVSGNYGFNYVSGTLTVTATAQPEFSIAEGGAVNKTYGSEAFTLTTAGGAGTGAVTWSSDDACVSVDSNGNVTINGAGTAIITATKAADDNYTAATAQTTVTVAQKELTVTAENKSKNYGEANPALTFTYNGFVNGDTAASLTTQPTASTEATAASGAGTYAITVSGGVSGNYTFNYVSGTLTINQAGQTALSVTQGANIAATYGDSVFTLSTTGGSGNGAVTWSSNNACVTVNAASGQVTIKSAGTATITATKAADSNYTAATAQTTVTVAKKTLTVTADNKSKIYGEVNPELTFTYNGFVNGEDKNILTTQPTISTTATQYSNVGTHTITVSGGAAANYTFDYIPALLTVSEATQPALSVMQGVNIAKTYGDSAFSLTLTGGAGTGAVTWSSDNACVSVDNNGNVTINRAGTATITATKAADGNYTAATAQTTVTVAQKELTVTAHNKSKLAGEVNPALTFTYFGFVNGEDENSLTTKPIISTDVTMFTQAGTYDIIVSGGVSNNYEFVYVDGTLTVIATYAITMSNDGNGTAVANVGGTNTINAAQDATVTITATPNTQYYQFNQWVVVGGGVTLSGTTTNPATFTMTASTVEIKAEFKPTAAAIAAANAEAAKITGFTTGTNTASSLVFTPTVSSALDGNATVNFVSVKTGQNATDAILTDWDASGLSLNTQKVVDGGDYTYVEVAFTVTLNGVTSDERTFVISGLFASGTTAGKLRTDKAKLPLQYTVTVASGFTGIVTIPGLQLSTGVSITPTNNNENSWAYGGRATLSSAPDGTVTLNITTAPASTNAQIVFDNVPLVCDGATYVVSVFGIQVKSS